MPHHPEKRYTPIAVGTPACNGKMNSIMKNHKDYCMDIIRMVAGLLTGWSVKKGGLSRVGKVEKSCRWQKGCSMVFVT